MRIEKINENSIRCILTSFDLSVRNLNLRELAYGTENARKLFDEMMTKASAEVGFNAENTPIMVEAIPMVGNAIQIVITKVEAPEELDTRFSKFSQAQNPTSGNEWLQRLTTELLEGADGLIQKLKDSGLLKEGGRGLQPGMQRGAAAPKDANGANADTDSQIRAFSFKDLDRVITAAKIISSLDIRSKLYKKEGEDSHYVLLLKCGEDASDFPKACNMIAEYGRKLKLSAASLAYYDEHYLTVIEDSAVQKLASI
ncbi:MAG TPA: adaptor protein MecA [Candidatus Avilachnospira avistercoris]|nr:adaptor protein MecA [Candidatus Avilachnospira avistercoris]